MPIERTASLKPSVSSMPSLKNCFQPEEKPSDKILFRTSAAAASGSFSILLNFVRDSFASSKSPRRIFHVAAQPDCAVSFMTSYSCDKVLTFVAASVAVMPSCLISAISFSLYPCRFKLSSLYVSVNSVKCCNVSVIISDVIHPLANVSRNDPSSAIISSMAMP